jgi:hypothetical protein
MMRTMLVFDAKADETGHSASLIIMGGYSSRPLIRRSRQRALPYGLGARSFLSNEGEGGPTFLERLLFVGALLKQV